MSRARTAGGGVFHHARHKEIVTPAAAQCRVGEILHGAARAGRQAGMGPPALRQCLVQTASGDHLADGVGGLLQGESEGVGLKVAGHASRQHTPSRVGQIVRTHVRFRRRAGNLAIATKQRVKPLSTIIGPYRRCPFEEVAMTRRVNLLGALLLSLCPGWAWADTMQEVVDIPTRRSCGKDRRMDHRERIERMS